VLLRNRQVKNQKKRKEEKRKEKKKRKEIFNNIWVWTKEASLHGLDVFFVK